MNALLFFRALHEKDITLPPNQPGFLHHKPYHKQMKLGNSMQTIKMLVGNNVLKSERCCGKSGTLGESRTVAAGGNIKILTSCPSCLQNGLPEADYIVVELANQILGKDWMAAYVAAATHCGIERVLV